LNPRSVVRVVGATN